MFALQIRLHSLSGMRVPVEENPSSWWGSSLSPSSSSNSALHWCPRVSVRRRLVISSRRSLDSFGNDRRWSGGRPRGREIAATTMTITFSFQVRMVRITERVLNTSYARVHIGKVGEQSVLSLDSRPSDAINLENRCKVPIYINRKIVSMDAIQVAYGSSYRKETKSIYDVLLDSATEGPDPVAEELNLVKKLNIAIVEERYGDAALWRDQLTKLRLAQHEA